MSDDQYISQIDAYIAGELNLQEREAFEQRLLVDPDLAEEVRIQQDIYRAMKGVSLEEFELKINRFAADARIGPGEGGKWILPLILLGGLIIVILLLALPMLNKDTNCSQDNLLSQIKEKAPSSLYGMAGLKTSRSQNQQPDTSKQELTPFQSVLIIADILYQDQEWENAISRMAEAPANSDREKEIQHINLALMHFLADQPDSSLISLSRLPNGSIYKSAEARWIEGFAYLAKGEFGQSRKSIENAQGGGAWTDLQLTDCLDELKE